MNNMDLISEGRSVILPYLPFDKGEITFERWKTRIKFFHGSAANGGKEKSRKRSE